jgi:hypothetical protein
MSSVLKGLSQIAGRKQQWVAHDKPGGRAANRRLRQRAALEARNLKRHYGVAIDAEGRTPAGIIVASARERRSMGGFGR